MSQALLRLAVKTSLAALLCLSSTLATADLKIKTRNSAMGHDSESTTYIKGARQRMEQGVPGMNYRSVTIYQCDLKRMITINDAARTYTITNIDVDPPASPEAAGASRRPANPKMEREEVEDNEQAPAEKGGAHVLTMASIDTYERQQMFGYNARHIRTLMAMDSSDDACSKEEMMMETDGWYIDMQYPFRCSVKYRPSAPMSRSEKPTCEDKFAMYRCEKGARKGFPLKEVSKIYTKEGQRISMSQETIDLSNAMLDVKLFDIPEGYTEVKSMSPMGGMTREQMMEMARQQQAQSGNNGTSPQSSDSGGLMAGGKWKKSSGESTTANSGGGATSSSDPSNSGGLLAGGKWKKSGGESSAAGSDSGTAAASGKQPGVIRVGVLAVSNQSGQSTSDMTDTLIEDLKSMQLDVVLLSGDAVADCKAKECDYILSAQISALKPASAGKRIGGFFGKVVGQGDGSGAIDATVAYKMFAPDGNTVKLDGTQTAREGTSAQESLTAVLRRVSGEVAKAIHK